MKELPYTDLVRINEAEDIPVSTFTTVILWKMGSMRELLAKNYGGDVMQSVLSLRKTSIKNWQG